jgi:triacylglycerol lipase
MNFTGDGMVATVDKPEPRLSAGNLARRGLAKSVDVPRYPVVFCHGMLAMSRLRLRMPKDPNTFATMRGFLQGRGVRALFPQVSPTGGVAVRAEQLREQIIAWTKEPVNVIAHSMGGMDARYLITHLGMADRVRSLTTISTAHHGTSVADWFCTGFPQGQALLWVLSLLGVNVDGFRDCRTTVCRDFNAQTPDMPGVQYFSYGAAVPLVRVSPALRRTWCILNAREGPNDGLVPTRSARWGTYLGTLAVDHFGLLPGSRYARPNKNFDALEFYLSVLRDLARRGF